MYLVGSDYITWDTAQDFIKKFSLTESNFCFWCCVVKEYLFEQLQEYLISGQTLLVENYLVLSFLNLVNN